MRSRSLHLRYNAAAQLFLQSSFDNADIPRIMSQRDVATYGGLCALASFTRTELKEKVMENPGFKEFLELFPEVRELIKGYGCLAWCQNTIFPPPPPAPPPFPPVPSLR